MNAIVLTINRRNRLELSTTIERLINLLDDIDGDLDFESDDDAEPEETDHNGDEHDYTVSSEDEGDFRSWHIDPTMRFMGGSGL